jgi:uncharacterized protein
MNILEFTPLIWLGSVIAGFLGALTGLGGGVVIVPLLALVFKVDIRYAIGASLVSVIGTSSGAAAAYVKEGYSNIRIGMFLEIATTLGALLGAFLAAKISTSWIAIIFAIVLLYSAFLSGRPRRGQPDVLKPDPLAAYLKLNGNYPTQDGLQSYGVRGIPAGFSLMFVAGALSGLLGIGSGAVKVLAMDQIMRIPFKVSRAQSQKVGRFRVFSIITGTFLIVIEIEIKRREENHKDTKGTKAWKCYLSLCQPVKKKSKRWIEYLALQNESVIHLFDFFFFSSGYKQVSCYCQSFVLFVSLWFPPFL